MDDSHLPTTPICPKQQIIDINAGTILRRENSRKDNLYYGCPIAIVLVLIIFIKCALLSVWVLREYDTFDFRCTAWDSDTSSLLFRTKRWSLFTGNTDPRNFSPKQKSKKKTINEVITIDNSNRKPYYGSMKLNDTNVEIPKIDPKLDFGPLPPTLRRNVIQERNEEDESEFEEKLEDDELPLSTMVTLTNTQLIPLKGVGTVKMKTIRNRVEKVGSDEEEFMEIDISDSPRIYVSKIKSRHGGEEDTETPTDFNILDDLKKKPKKTKGKGLKKMKKKMMEEAKNKNETLVLDTVEDIKNNSKDEKKKRLKNKKKNKERHHKKHNHTTEQFEMETTKNPRHLVSGASLTNEVTPRPEHKSSWIDGVVDPNDPKFSNQGEIRGYTMQKATKIPTTTPNSFDSEEKIRISERTRKMWEMDEVKFTTFMAPKTTQITKLDSEKNLEEKPEFVEEKIEKVVTYEEPTTTKTLTSEVYQISIPIENKPKTSYQPQSIYEVKTTTKKLPAVFIGTTSDTSNNIEEINDADTKTIHIGDSSSYPKLWMNQGTTTTTERPYDPQHFENELNKLKDSTICMARMAFDVWCLFMLFSAVPFVTGICVPRWSLFVLHIVFDFLFLVIGFVSSLTIAIMSTIMYFLIDEMSSDALFEFLLVSFVTDIILIIYSLLIVISYRCCSRLVENFIKDSTNSTYSSLPEQV
ncbi:unnamed protein product [Caenorhabditis angaria]|uniref:Uncharacterized protein n=1 Tax=Caenorhabditis angaria TaxID=860376 RepID=A0A9P1I5J9_9PELO|nr:unnamed protein product [Caenorhabditis angaria]